MRPSRAQITNIEHRDNEIARQSISINLKLFEQYKASPDFLIDLG